MTEKTKSKAVLKITQSPLNKLRWSIDLECGHEQWVTSHTKPKKKRMLCRDCDPGRPVPPHGSGP